MGAAGRFEKKISNAVNTVFARAFKGDVQPVEITARLQRELDLEGKVLSRDKRLVPNGFRIGLSRHDYDRLFPYSKTLNAEIIPQLREHAASRGYVFNGPITIVYELDPTQPTGSFTLASEAVAGVDGAAPVSTTLIRKAALVLEVNGVRHPLTPPGLVIGRGTEADLRINDPGISRRHAEIVVSGQGEDQRVSINDLGSTNGILVNGHRVRQADLSDGSRIDIGSTRLLVLAPAGG